MCGISGCILHQPQRVSLDRLKASIKTLHHRGPDDQGLYIAGNVGLAHARLSILDLSASGHQPMTSHDHSKTMVYNGELYNFRELVSEESIADLRSTSDSEVLLEYFSKKGLRSLPGLNGMFAFAVHDRIEKSVYLVRDRLGIKPLYYTINQEGLFFGSEIKAIDALTHQQLEGESSNLSEWLYFGNNLGQKTLYKGVLKLPPGCCLEISTDTLELTLHRYWSVSEAMSKPATYNHTNIGAEIRDKLANAVHRQMVADVPIGIFLSGGIDSTAITAYASQFSERPIKTFSAGFDFDKGINELADARAVATRYKTDHTEFQIKGQDIGPLIEKMVDHHDLPFSDAANLPLYLMSNHVKGDVGVILQGDGGDELFAGYRRYNTLGHIRPLNLLARLVKIGLPLAKRHRNYRRIRRYLNALSAMGLDRNVALLMTEEDIEDNPAQIFSESMQAKLKSQDPFSHYSSTVERFKNHDIVNMMSAVDLSIILPDIFLEKVDRSTMAASLEVRVPFLDNDLVNFAIQLEGKYKVKRGQKKWLLRNSLRGIVSDEVLDKPKTGFGVPYGYWLREDLKDLFMDHLTAIQSSSPGLLDTKKIQHLYKQHVDQKTDRSFLLWKVLNLMIFVNRKQVTF